MANEIRTKEFELSDDDIWSNLDNIQSLREKLDGEWEEEVEEREGKDSSTTSMEGSQKEQESNSNQKSETEQKQNENGNDGEPKQQENKPKENKELDLKQDMKCWIKPKEFNLVKMAIEQNWNPLLYGEAGCGKTDMCIKAAQELGLDFYTNSSVKDEFKLEGSQDIHGNYIPSQFYLAFKNGGLYLLDEIDGSNPDVLIAINTALSQGCMSFPVVGLVKKNKNFRFAATANTICDGASIKYSGRNGLDGATTNRFGQWIECKYDPKVEKAICKDDELRSFIQDYRKSCSKVGLDEIISYRQLGTIYQAMFGKTKLDAKTAIRTMLLRGVEKENGKLIYSHMQFEDNIYYNTLKELVGAK